MQPLPTTPTASCRPVARLFFVPMMLLLLGLLLASAATPPCDAATTYYVSPSGNDGNAGTPAAPYKTIQSGINNAASGDTVLITDGNYTGSGDVDLDLGGKNITVTSQHGAENTIINCQGSAADNHRGFYLHHGETNAVINGLTIENGYVSSTDGNSVGAGIYNSNTGGGTITVTGCTLTGNTAQSGGGGGIWNANSGGGGTIIVSGCTFTGNTAPYGGGIDNSNGDVGTITMTGCTLTGNTAEGGGGIINANADGGKITETGCAINGNTAPIAGGVLNENNRGGSITMTNCTLTGNKAMASPGNANGGGLLNNNDRGGGITISSCTLTGNRGPDGSGGASNSNDHGAITFTNDILYGDTDGELAVQILSGYSGIAVINCDVQGGYAGTGNINVDPLFIYSPTEVHLKPGSPCLGAGTAAGAPPTDKDGRTRPDPPSIGAYEATGAGHTHLLWNNPDGRVILWSIAPDGSFTYHVFGPYDDGSPNTTWYAAALATGPDGKSHILWTNPDGRVILWTVDDSGSFSYQVYGPYTDDGTAATTWNATALSVGADNIVHILWTNPDGRVILWNVDSAFNFTYGVFGPYTDDGTASTPWSATALATGPDNVTRVVWNNPDGRVILWDVDNSFHFVYHVYGPYTDGTPSTPWSASAVSVGPDNMTHLVWNNPDRHVILWSIDSAFGFTYQVYGEYDDGPPATPWVASALATGPDNLSHLLWSHPDNRVILWGVDSGFSFIVNVFGPYTDGSPNTTWRATAVSAGP